MIISRQKYIVFLIGICGGIFSGIGLSEGWVLFTLPAIALLWSSKEHPFAGFLWGSIATLISHRWLLSLHPLSWIGVPNILSLPITIFLWSICSFWGGLLIECWCLLGRSTFFKRSDHSSLKNQFLVAFALSLIWGLSEVLLAKSPLFLFGISSSLLPQDRWLAGLARWFGAGGLTALQLLLGWWIWQIALALKKRHSILRLFTWGVFVLVISHYLGWSLISINNYSFTKRIALWQTNVPIKEKFSSSHLKDLPTAIDDALNEAKKTGSEWLVAPEGTLLADQTLLSPAVIPFLSGGFRWVDGKQRSSLLVFNTGSSSFNEAIDKYRLVPLGEWIPKLPSFAFKGLSLVGGLDPGQSSRFLKWEGPPAGVAICYELSDGKSLAKAANKGAQWILSIANLDPYPISLQKQFISLAQLRGIELARDVISVANTGPTSLINSSGQVKQVVVPFIKGVGTVEVSFSNQISGYSRWGELPMIFGLIVAIFEITRLKEKSEYVG